MRVSRSKACGKLPRPAAKSRTRSEIIAAASKLIRKKGLAAASVNEVMRGAGLTVGGFYAHFRSKAALDAEVLRATLTEVRAKWFAGLDRDRPKVWVAQLVERYLAPSHRDRTNDGCPLPAVLSELARSDKAARQALAEGFEAYAKEFSACAPEAPGVTPRERALATWALCIGGLAVARALHGHPQSDEALGACKKWATLPESLPE